MGTRGSGIVGGGAGGAEGPSLRRRLPVTRARRIAAPGHAKLEREVLDVPAPAREPRGPLRRRPTPPPAFAEDIVWAPLFEARAVFRVQSTPC